MSIEFTHLLPKYYNGGYMAIDDERVSEFTAWLKEKMEASGWTQSDLANVSGLTRQAIGNYANGKRLPNREAIAAIAKAFNVPLEHIYNIAGVPFDDYNSVMSESDKIMLRLFSDLDQDQQEELIEIAKYKRRKMNVSTT